MKYHRFFFTVLAFAALALTASAADKTPTLPIDQALKIAQDYLNQHGLAAEHPIVSITLEAATVHNLYWYAHWHPAIPDGQKTQVGLRVDMDGTPTVIVTGPSGGYDPPVGQRAYGARNIH